MNSLLLLRNFSLGLGLSPGTLSNDGTAADSNELTVDHWLCLVIILPSSWTVDMIRRGILSVTSKTKSIVLYDAGLDRHLAYVRSFSLEDAEIVSGAMVVVLKTSIRYYLSLQWVIHSANTSGFFMASSQKDSLSRSVVRFHCLRAFTYIIAGTPTEKTAYPARAGMNMG
jgi:hypothetical protein